MKLANTNDRTIYCAFSAVILIYVFYVRSPSALCQNVRFNGLNCLCSQQRTAVIDIVFGGSDIARNGCVRIFNTNVTGHDVAKILWHVYTTEFWTGGANVYELLTKIKKKTTGLELNAHAFVYGRLCL